jgi:DNA-binding MurR/RpiR family transcriptional regulator
MNVLQNLMELYNKLPIDSTYRSVAKGILENLNRIGDMTIYEVADITNSSRTTVWRMVQKMGYENYSDFRHALKAAVSQYTYYNRMLPLENTQNIEKVVGSFVSRMQHDLSLIETNLTTDRLIELTDILKYTKRISFYLPYRTYAIYSLQQNLAMDGKQTSYFCLLPEMLEDVKQLDESSLVIASSIEFAETLDMSAVFKTAKQKGAMLLLASGKKSRYSHFADEFLLDPGEENTYQALSSILEILFLSMSEIYRTRFVDKLSAFC